MKYVLDTNVVKRLATPKRNANVDKWLAVIDEPELFITCMTVQEVQKGIELLRRQGSAEKVETARQIEVAFDVFLSQVEGRILPLDAAAARDWGRRLARHGTRNANDLAIIAIVATQKDAVAVTQNLADFRHRGIRVLNPYDDPPSQFNDAET
ncbi:MAG: toxin/antitoxin system PilT protein [Massilia sp.]|nr:toxin/antitoxin system PilT protein [Massilia sp.]